MSGIIRQPVVAGTFYPANPYQLKEMIKKLTPEKIEQLSGLGLIAPHAGYIYSGRTAAATFASLKLTGTILLLGPKHTPYGEEMAVFSKGAWQFPGGEFPIDTLLAEHLMGEVPGLKADTLAHLQEHSLEVILPFIHYYRPDASIVPIAFAYLSLDKCKIVGEALGKALQRWTTPVTLVISTDLNHYEDQETTLRKDQIAIDKILELDPKGLYEACAKYNISMCGIIPVTIALFALKQLDLSEARLISHTTSAETSGDYRHVVGYAGFILR